MIWSRGVAGLVLAALVTCGCAATEPGRAVGPDAGAGTTSGGVSTSGAVSSSGDVPTTDAPCTDITIMDPTIAFESSLSDGAELAVGDTGWIHADVDAADIDVSGDPGTVKLADRSMTTEIACGEPQGSASWIEVSGKRAGDVVLTLPGNPTRTIAISVR